MTAFTLIAEKPFRGRDVFEVFDYVFRHLKDHRNHGSWLLTFGAKPLSETLVI
jgi:hypothetical protein